MSRFKKNLPIYVYKRGFTLKGIRGILLRLLQRSKKCRGHYSTMYHATSRSETRTYLLLIQCEEIRVFEV